VEPTTTVAISRWSGGSWKLMEDVVVCEYVLTVYMNSRRLVKLHCLPEHLDELIAGYLRVGGFISTNSDLVRLEIDSQQGTAQVYTATNASARPALTSGLADGQDSSRLKVGRATFGLKPEQVLFLIKELQRCSTLFKLTGGVHSAGLGTAQELILYRQDIGRHNAVDKIIGSMLLRSIKPEDKALVLSGRISADIVLKAATAELPLLLSPSAPTHLAVDLARRLGITLVGFARNTRLSIYSEAWRVKPESPARGT